MARLTAQQWEQARADYEVRGLSQGEVARRHGVSQQAVAKRAKAEGWKQGKSCALVSEKVAAIKSLAKVERESCELSTTFRETINDEVRSQLELEGIRRNFHFELYDKGRALLREVTTASEWKTLTSGARDLMPPQDGKGTVVNVNQQQAQQAQAMTPEQICAELIAQQKAEIEAADGTETR